MAGATSIIKSSTFDGVDVGGGSYANATTGWLINGSGRAYFYDATVAGSIDIGGFDSGSFHVDSDGNLWLGSGTLVNAPFKVLKEGDVTANTITTKNLTLTGPTVMSSNSKIYLGVGVYGNTNTPFYVDDTSQFSLGDKLTWNGSTLSITGDIVITSGSTLTSIQTAQSTANTAQSTANIANTTANNANNVASTAIQPGSLEARIGDSVTSISGGKIATGTLNANRITAGTLSASQISTGTLSADFISGGTIDASNISGVNITGVTISGSSLQVGGRILLPVDGGQILLGTSSGGYTTQCYVFAGGSQGLWVDTNASGSMWIAGQSLYPNLNQFTFNRYIVGLTTDTGSGNTLFVSGGQVYRSSSKRELKENIQDFSDIGLIDGLRPRTFTWKAFINRKDQNNEETEEQKLRRESAVHIGFIAEEVEEASNGLLSMYNYEEDGNGEVEMYKHLDILALAVANIQDLRKRVADLENS